MSETSRILQPIKLTVLIAACTILGIETSTAQTPFDEDIIVVAPFEPIIREAEKINIQPGLEETPRPLPKFDINIIPRKLNVTLPFETQDAAKPPAPVQEALYRNIISAGFGNYTTPFLSFVANTRHNPRFAASMQLRHLSSHGQIKNYGYSGYSDNSASLSGNIIGRRHTIGASLQYLRNSLHHYGFLADSFPVPQWDLSEQNIKQRFNTAAGELSFKSNANNNRLRFESRAGYRYFIDRFNTTEHNTALKLEAALPVTWLGNIDNQDISTAITFNNFSTTDSVETRNNLLAGFQPGFTLRYNEYELEAGFLVNVAHDTTTTVHLFPQAEAKLHIIRDRFTIFTGVSGRVEQNSFHALAQTNPFIASRLQLKNSVEELTFYGGITAAPFNRVAMRIELANSEISNMPLFVNDSIAPGNRFLVLYDNMNVVRGSIDFSYELAQVLSLRVGGRYFHFTPGTQGKAWHRPDYDIFVEGRYSFLEKWAVSSRFRLMGPSYAKIYKHGQQQQVVVDGWADLSAHATYQFNNQLHFFLSANNLTGHRQYYWNQYPSKSINLLFGAGFSF